MSVAAHGTGPAASAFRPLVTMSPVVRTGLATRDLGRLPPDEFAARVRAAEEVCRAASLDALAVTAHAAHPAAVTYLTNFRPTARVGAVVIVPGHDPVLMAGMGGRRDESFQRTVSWTADLVPRPLTATTLLKVLEDRGVTAGRLGIAGLDYELPARDRERFTAGCAGFELVAVDAELAALRRRLSPRELSVLADADAIVREAAQAGLRTFTAGRSPALAAVAMERAARMRGCGDVRLLIGYPDGSLRPFEAVEPMESELLVCHLAAEFRGYWAERAFTFPWSRLPPGADLRPVIAGMATLGPGSGCQLAPAGDVECALRALGIDPVDLPDEQRGWRVLEAGDAVSLVAAGVAGGRVVLHSDSFVITAAGPRPLAADVR